MATVDLTTDNFENTVTDDNIVLIDFWADWCGPCKTFGPTFDKVSENHPDIVFAKVNTDEQQDLAMQFGVQSIPTVAVFRERVLLFRQAGALPESALEEIITKVRDLDMDEVHAKVREQQAAQAQ